MIMLIIVIMITIIILLQALILPIGLAETPYKLVSSALKAWITLTNAAPPTCTVAHCQKEWYFRYRQDTDTRTGLLKFTSTPRNHARLLASPNLSSFWRLDASFPCDCSGPVSLR